MELTEELLASEVDQVEDEEIQKGPKIQLIVFLIAGEEYALPIDQVKEIVLTPRVSKVPQTPEYVLGISNIRGNIISIMDLEKKFGLKVLDDGDTGKASYTMVIESADFQVGIKVEKVPNTLSVFASKIDTSANIMQYASLDETVLKGAVKLGERIIILLDVLKMLEVGELKTKV
ncbi:MAG: purine-binding chemotaxis protein CheW [Ekhidna sp.]|nr:purine-binding chemotaxis protein CheW [Ekhidna sp.]